MRYQQRRVAHVIFLWILLFALHNAAASTRQRQPFARFGRLNDDNANETIKNKTIDPLNEEAENHTVADGLHVERRRRPLLSNWFAPSMNQKRKEEEEDCNKQELNDSNSIEANKTSRSEWPQGRYWPTSSQRQTTTPSDGSSSASKEDSKQKDTKAEETEEADVPPVDPLKEVDSETEPPTFQPPFRNLFRELRKRLTPLPGKAEAGRDTESIDEQANKPETTTDLNATQVNHTLQEVQVATSDANATASQIETETATLFTRIKDSSETVTTFLRHLPWQRPQQQPNGLQEGRSTEVFDGASAESRRNVTENATIVAQAEGLGSDHTNSSSPHHIETQSLDEVSSIEEGSSHFGPIPIFTRLKESAGNTTAFARRKMRARREARKDASKHENTTRVVSSNPITVIRNLPWTREEGKKYSENVVPSPPTRVNPFQFVRGLPWTPRRASDMSESYTSSTTDVEQSESPSSYNETHHDEIQFDTMLGEREEDLSDVSSMSDNLTNIDGNVSSSDSASLSQDCDNKDEELALEVEDVLSKYRVRQEDEIAPNNWNDRHIASGKKQNQLATEDTSTVSFTTDEKVEESGRDGVKSKEEIAVEESNDDRTGESYLRLDSLFSRVLGSMESQQKTIEAKNKTVQSKTDDTSLSNVTTTNESEDTVPNKTQPLKHEGKPLPNQSRDQPLDQPPHPQQQQPTVIIMGGGPQDGRPLPADLARRPVPTPSLVLIEALVTIFGTAFRIWMISFLAKWWSEEETLKPVQHFVWERLNDRYLRDSTVLQNVLQLPPTGVIEWKWRRFLRRQHRVEGKAAEKKITLAAPTFARTVIVLNIDAELNIPQLEQAVTFILSQHREQAFGSIGGMAKELEVVLLVNSPGGAVSDYGLAGAQIRRLADEAGVTTTVCVDHIAASGGYMIASQADRIFASNFAIVGSIGVIREGFNVHEALERHGIKGFALKAGDSKVPLTMFGPVTKGDMSKAQRTLDLMHRAFKVFVVQGRPLLEADIDDVANGDVYFGDEAMQLSLIDRIVTSEEYLLERVQAGDRVMKLHRAHQFTGRRRQLFHPLDFLREKGTLEWNKWIPSDARRILSRAIAAASAMGAFQFLTNQNFLFGGS